ncbi:Hypothetical predicted protein [Mytilus galloprovincialis]|uniref:Sema domain-containing protein n=1 Tax=Mytilus galloprovincialis TaxID=29158 RepID=A0A8B6F4U3_MYTGA|nr:Hypothetical predicted protein [Mytilus galloprovincialis]
MIVTDDKILIGGVGGIAVLKKENMTERQNNSLYSKNWLLLFDGKRDEIIQCNENLNNISSCSKLQAGTLFESVKSQNMTVDLQNIPTYSMVNVTEVNTNIVIIGANIVKFRNISYGILSFNLTDFNLFQTEFFGKGPMNIELADSENYTLAFKSSFFHAPHVFFFFQVHAHNTFASSRIGKLCLNYEKKSNKTGFYHSYEDMNMTCTHREITLRKIEYALDDGESVIVLFLHNRSSLICVYSWHDINKYFLESRKSKLPCGNTTEDGEYYEFTRQQNRHVDCFVTKGNETVCDKAENVYLHLKDKPEEFKASVLQVATSRILHVKVEKERAYYLTENKIEKFDFKDCSRYTECKQCMDSLNPYCGWDYNEKRCSKNNSDPVLWISPETGFCIHFTNISNAIQINTENYTSIDVVIMAPPDVKNIQRGLIRCRVNEREGNITFNQNVTSCNINIRGLMTGNYSFEIKYKEVILAETLIEFYKCEDLKTLDADREENPENELLRKNRNIHIPLPEHGSGRDDLCPHKENYSKFNLYANRSENVTIPVRGFESNLTSSNYTCEISQNGKIVNTLEVLWDMKKTYFTCIGVQLNESVKPYIVRLKFNDLYFDNEVALNVYTCDGIYKYEDCSNSQYVKNCQRNNNVTVEKIYPVSGPVNGGTSITVTVNNEDDEPEYFFIDEAECTDITEEKEKNSDEGYDSERSDKSDKNESSRFSCVTGKILEPNNATIQMSFKGFPSPITKNIYFTYKNPGDIQNFYPNKGILAGNTTIIISGQNITFEGPDRYSIEFCDESSVRCIECRLFEIDYIDIGRFGMSADVTSLHPSNIS